jgi:mycothiol synthase
MLIREAHAEDGEHLDRMMTGYRGWLGARLHEARFAHTTAPWLRLVAVEDGIPIGYAETLAAPILRGGRAPSVVFIAPGHRGQGIGAALWDRLLPVVREAGVAGLLLVANREDASTPALAGAHGLVDVGEHLESSLELADLPTVDIDVRPLPIESDEDRDQVYELLSEIARDTPDIADGQGMQRAMFDRLVREPWQGCLLYVGDDIAGIIVGFARDEPGEANIALVGVRAAFRGRGLAAPLMAAWGQVLLERGFVTLVTQNLTLNTPILAANRRLGFQVRGGYRDLAYDF